MAKNMSISLDNIGSRSRAYHVLGLVCLALLMRKSVAREFQVGGKGTWGAPSDNTSLDYNQWAERNRFQIGDCIVFNYASGQDSVLQVNKDGYTSCNTEHPMERYTDGHTVFTFKQAGPHYFISGNRDNCLDNEKLVVIVMADRSNNGYANKTTGTTSPSPTPSPSSDVVPASAPVPATGEYSNKTTGTSPSPPPSPSRDVVPAPAPVDEYSNKTIGTSPSPPPSPTSNVVPAPAPAGEYSPPEGTVEANPTSAPEPNNKPSAASSNFINLVSSIGGAIAASSLLLVS